MAQIFLKEINFQLQYFCPLPISFHQATGGHPGNQNNNGVDEQVQQGYVQIGESVLSNSEINNTLGVFYQNTSDFVYQGGTVILSSNSEGTGQISTDDRVKIKVTHPNGSVSNYEYTFGYPQRWGVEVTDPVDVTYLFDHGRNKVEISYENTYPGGASSTAYYLTVQK